MTFWLLSINPVLQALIATLFTFFITVLGAAVVFFFKNVNKNIMDMSLSLSAGVMLAASFFSLINPSINMAISLNMTSWIVCGIGILFGGIFLFICDFVFSKNNNSNKDNFMLLFSITIHNLPEGMAIGVAFGSLIYGIEGSSLMSACMLALGIGIQNFPEGSSISLPLKRSGLSTKKSFLLGAISAVVEPIGGILGALLVIKIRFLLPYLLAFSAGAMIYVIVTELIPESQTSKKKSLMTLTTIVGFIIMMILDIALG